MSTPWSWSRGGGRQADKVGWSQKVTEMGRGTDKDRKGKKGGCTMTGMEEETSWISAQDLKHAQDVIRIFHHHYPSKLGPTDS